MVHEIAEELGFGVKTVRNTINTYVHEGTVSSPRRKRIRNHSAWKALDDFSRTAIRFKVHEFFRRNELPTLNAVLASVNEDEDLPNFTRTTFYR